MKLSPIKKFGHVHVMGKRLVRVTKEHAVSTEGAPLPAKLKTNVPNSGLNSPEGKWVYCKEGDLAVELVEVKKKRHVGYSYLSGPAIQMTGYTAQAGWFEDAELASLKAPMPPTTPEEGEEAIMALMKLKYHGADLYVVSGNLKLPKEHKSDWGLMANNYMNGLGNAWGMVDRQARARGFRSGPVSSHNRRASFAHGAAL